MTKLATLILTFAFGTLTLGYGQSPKVDFNGQWQLDTARSEGVPPGMNQVMTVKQDGERLEVQIKLSGPDGERTASDSYSVNGKPADFTPVLVGGPAAKEAKRTSAWSGDGRGFDAVEQATVDGPEGEGVIKASRNWRLSEDGKTLTIEMAVELPDSGVTKSKRVFSRV